MEWISVNDRLPEHDLEVLVHGCKWGGDRGFHVNSEIHACWFNGHSFLDSKLKSMDNNNDFWKITHWMPLPEAPK